MEALIVAILIAIVAIGPLGWAPERSRSGSLANTWKTKERSPASCRASFALYGNGQYNIPISDEGLASSSTAARAPPFGPYSNF